MVSRAGVGSREGLRGAVDHLSQSEIKVSAGHSDLRSLLRRVRSMRCRPSATIASRSAPVSAVEDHSILRLEGAIVGTCNEGVTNSVVADA